MTEQTEQEQPPFPSREDLDAALAVALRPPEPREQPRARPRLTAHQRRWLTRVLYERDVDPAAFAVHLGDESRLLDHDGNIDTGILAQTIAATIWNGAAHD